VPTTQPDPLAPVRDVAVWTPPAGSLKLRVHLVTGLVVAEHGRRL